MQPRGTNPARAPRAPLSDPPRTFHPVQPLPHPRALHPPRNVTTRARAAPRRCRWKANSSMASSGGRGAGEGCHRATAGSPSSSAPPLVDLEDDQQLRLTPLGLVNAAVASWPCPCLSACGSRCATGFAPPSIMAATRLPASSLLAGNKPARQRSRCQRWAASQHRGAQLASEAGEQL